MFTTVAFYESMTNGVTYQEVNGVLDQSITTDASNRFQSPGAWQLLAAHVHGVNLSAAQINAPSLRTLALPEIYPCNPAATIATGTGPVEMGDRGISFIPAESFIIQISRAGADAQPVFGALWIGPGVQPATRGKTTTIVASASVTAVVGSWVLGSITFNQTLPAGKYEVVGMAVLATGVSYARLVFPGQSQYRPGVVCQATYGNIPWTHTFRMGRFGSFGTFFHNAPPSVEYLGNTAGAITPTIYLDVVKVG